LKIKAEIDSKMPEQNRLFSGKRKTAGVGQLFAFDSQLSVVSSQLLVE